MKKKTEWAWGDKTRLAAMAGISPAYLSDIIHGRRSCPPDRAMRLEFCASALGYRIPCIAWAFHQYRKDNPLFPQS